MLIFNNFVSGPNHPGNHVQPGQSKLTANPQVASHAVGANVLRVNLENEPKYSQPGSETRTEGKSATKRF
jgi:hypothetical protein